MSRREYDDDRDFEDLLAPEVPSDAEQDLAADHAWGARMQQAEDAAMGRSA